MAHLNVYVTGAPPEKSVRVDASAAAAHDWAEVGIVFPAFRLTDPHGVINFIHTDTPLLTKTALGRVRVREGGLGSRALRRHARRRCQSGLRAF